MTYWERFTKLHGLLVASGSTQTVIILSKTSHQALSDEINMLRGIQPKITAAVTHYGEIAITSDDYGVNLEDVL